MTEHWLHNHHSRGIACAHLDSLALRSSVRAVPVDRVKAVPLGVSPTTLDSFSSAYFTRLWDMFEDRRRRGMTGEGSPYLHPGTQITQTRTKRTYSVDSATAT